MQSDTVNVYKHTMSPIFIIGVPRSGTTLLRTVLDSHPNISCGPESPWLACMPLSIKKLYEFMRNDDLGFCKSYKMEADSIRPLFARLTEDIYSAYAYNKGKYRWAEKTPDHSLHIPFLAEIFPDACFIHIVRDGRDVACSTTFLDEEKKKISSWHSKNISLSATEIVPNTVENAATRWVRWLNIIERDLKNVKHYTLRYEDLVKDPESEIKSLLIFLGEPYHRLFLEYASRTHDFPDWEWGSHDVSKMNKITHTQIGRWKEEIHQNELKTIESITGEKLIKYGYPLSTEGNELSLNHKGIHLRQESNNHELFNERCKLASVIELNFPQFREFMVMINSKADRLGLRQFTNWSKVWEYPWLWFNGLCRLDWSKTTVLDLGSELSPMPWFLASLGAKVTLLETDTNSIHIWERTRRETGLSVEWKIIDDEQLPFRDESFDVVTSFSVIEHQLDKGKAVNEIARVLKPGGTFALSFDICEPEMGMTFPEWNGKALTTREFEDTIWNHPAFKEKVIPLKWNFEDCREFVNWHLQSAPHHNYAVGAAVLQKIGLGESKTINVKRIVKPVFLHMPKAAGTTFLQMLINAFGQEHVYWLNHFEYQDSFKKLHEIEQADPEKICVITGHINYGIHNILSNKYDYFTVLRDPVQRVLSFLDYAYSSTQHPLYEILRKGPIDFSDPKIINNISNLQTRILCNSTIADPSLLASVSEEYLKIAKQRLQNCAVVGITEDFDGFIRLVNHRFGWNLSKIQKQNVTPECKYRTQIDQAMIERIREFNKLDIELYEYARELFYKQLLEIGK